MAENKKSFISYCEWQETFEELSDEDAGALIKHIFRYVNDENPSTDNVLVKLCFIPIKQTLKRDLKKYETYIDKQKQNGAKGGRPKKTQKTQAFLEKPKKADSVNVNVNKEEEVLKIYDIFVNEVKNGNHNIAIEQWYMSLKIEKGSLTNLLYEFKTQLLTDLKIHKNTLELRKHFYSWLTKLDTVGKLKKYKL